MVDQKQQKKARDRINTHNLYNQRSKEKGFEGVHCFITNGNGVGSGSFRAAGAGVWRRESCGWKGLELSLSWIAKFFPGNKLKIENIIALSKWVYRVVPAWKRN